MRNNCKRTKAALHCIVLINLRYQHNPFDHTRAVRSGVRGFNKNPLLNSILIGSLITTDYHPTCLKR